MFLSLIRRHEGWVSFGLVLALILGGFVAFQAFFSLAPLPPPTPVPVANVGDPTLALYPAQGPAGTYVGVTGAGWPGAATVTILLVDGQGARAILATSMIAADGSLATGFLYPFDQRWLTPGSYTVIAEIAASGVQATTPFLVSSDPIPTTVTPTVTSTLLTATSIPTATALPSAPPTVLPTETATVAPTVLPTLTPTESAIPTPLPTDTPPLPTDTPPPVNQPPQLQAALLPIDIDDDRQAGVFQLQVQASDVEGSLQTVLIILKLPSSAREREVKQKEDDKIEIKFSEKRLDIKGPDPQALLAQITAYGGLLLQNGQQIDLRIKNRAEGKVELRGEVWRIEARAIELTVIATDAAGLTSTVQVTPCGEVDCSVSNGNNNEEE